MIRFVVAPTVTVWPCDKGENVLLAPQQSPCHPPPGATHTDVDECATGIAACAPGAACTNTVGSYFCTCPLNQVAARSGCEGVHACMQHALPVIASGFSSIGLQHLHTPAGPCDFG
jgi:hypothetical protein